MTFTMIELFAGIGGGSAAAEQVVDPATKHPLFRPILAAEIDSDARIFFKANFPETRLEGDIKKIEEIPLDAHILVAGPPCQSFSLAGKKEGFSGKSGEGFEIFINFIKRAKPQIILFENVKDITSTKYLPTIEKKFKEAGYDIKLAKFNSLDFGMPQHRVRVYIVAVRSNLPLSSKLKTFSFPKPKYSSKEKLISPLYFALEDLTNRPQKDDTNKLAHEIISEHLKAIVKNEERKEEIEERKEEKRVDDNHVLSDKKGNTRVINTKNTVGAQLYSRFYGAGGGKLVVGPDEKKDAAPSKTSDPKSKITLRFTEIAGPAPTLTQINPIIGMLGRRMIGRELANIQGFPTTYKIPVSFRNRLKRFTKLFGNSFSVPVIRTLLAQIATHFFDAPALELRKEKHLPKLKKTDYTDKDMLLLRQAVLQDDRGYIPTTSPFEELRRQYSESFVVSRRLLNVRSKRKGSAFETVSATEAFLRKKARVEDDSPKARLPVKKPPLPAPTTLPVLEAPIDRLESISEPPAFPLIPVARRASSLFVPAAASPAAPETTPSLQATLGLSVYLAPLVIVKDAHGNILYTEEELDRGWVGIKQP